MCNISHKFISLLMIFTIMVNIGVMPTYASENEYKTVYADNGFVRIEIEKDAVFTSGSHTFKFTPTKTGDYAFFFDKLSFDKEPEVVLSVSAGTLPVELEYKEDVAYYDATDETKNTVADGVYQHREGLSDYFVTGKSHI